MEGDIPVADASTNKVGGAVFCERCCEGIGGGTFEKVGDVRFVSCVAPISGGIQGDGTGGVVEAKEGEGFELKQVFCERTDGKRCVTSWTI